MLLVLREQLGLLLVQPRQELLLARQELQPLVEPLPQLEELVAFVVQRGRPPLQSWRVRGWPA